MERKPVELKCGATFAVYSGDPEDQEIVTIKAITSTHVFLESMGDLHGWKPRDLVEGAIAEASAQQSLHI